MRRSTAVSPRLGGLRLPCGRGAAFWLVMLSPCAWRGVRQLRPDEKAGIVHTPARTLAARAGGRHARFRGPGGRLRCVFVYKSVRRWARAAWKTGTQIAAVSGSLYTTHGAVQMN